LFEGNGGVRVGLLFFLKFDLVRICFCYLRLVLEDGIGNIFGLHVLMFHFKTKSQARECG
jgi:hypothetical protein